MVLVEACLPSAENTQKLDCLRWQPFSHLNARQRRSWSRRSTVKGAVQSVSVLEHSHLPREELPQREWGECSNKKTHRRIAQYFNKLYSMTKREGMLEKAEDLGGRDFARSLISSPALLKKANKGERRQAATSTKVEVK